MQICSIYSFIVFTLFILSCHNKGGVIHNVSKGETSYRIAHTYQVGLDYIQKANPRLDLAKIFPNQKILIPGAKENRKVQNFIDNKIKHIDIEKNKVKKNQKNSNSKIRPLKKTKKVSKLKNQKKISFIWPYKGTVLSKYGMKNSKMHNGIDISTPKKHRIVAAENGEVVFADSTLEGYDKMIIIQHEQKIFSIYAYLGNYLIKKGDIVKKGQVIAVTKNTNNSFFHFEIRIAKKALDPEKHL